MRMHFGGVDGSKSLDSFGCQGNEQSDFHNFLELVKGVWNKIPEFIKPMLVVVFHTAVLIMIMNLVNIIPLTVNLLLVLPVVCLLTFLFPYKIACIIETILFVAIYYTNEFVKSARSNPINFLDIYSIGDAMAVANRYKLPLSFSIITKILLFVVATILTFRIFKKIALRKNIKSYITLFICALFTPCFVYLLTCGNLLKTDALGFNEIAYLRRLGFFYGIYNEYLNTKSSPPENYSEKTMQALKNKYSYTSDSVISENKVRPERIIVVMNEALADFSLIGEADMDYDPLSHFHAMDENCTKGKMYVNVFGGGTCNTEFEFLSGCAKNFTYYSAPYNQLILNNCETFVSDVNKLGYNSTALHPFLGKEWHRRTVYKEFGFSEFIAGEDWVEGYEYKDIITFFDPHPPYFGETEYCRELISDAECYRKIENIAAEDRKQNVPSFIFCVTMQNHSGYTDEFEYSDMKEYIPSGKKAKYPFALNLADGDVLSLINKSDVEIAANQYLNLVNISDEAFADFIEYLKNDDVPTVVVMFGDHEPALSFGWYKNKYSDDGNEYEKFADYFIVPYIMWANYDMEWEEHEQISANYLSAVLKRSCGFPLNEFDNVRLAAMEEYPVLTERIAVNKNGEFVFSDEIYNSQVIRDYELFQYDKLEKCKQ